MNLIAEAARFCLIFRMLPRVTTKINPPLALMINHPLTVVVLPIHSIPQQVSYIILEIV